MRSFICYVIYYISSSKRYTLYMIYCTRCVSLFEQRDQHITNRRNHKWGPTNEFLWPHLTGECWGHACWPYQVNLLLWPWPLDGLCLNWELYRVIFHDFKRDFNVIWIVSCYAWGLTGRLMPPTTKFAMILDTESVWCRRQQCDQGSLTVSTEAFDSCTRTITAIIQCDSSNANVLMFVWNCGHAAYTYGKHVRRFKYWTRSDL